MRLTELTGVKKYQDMTQDELATLLNDMTPYKKVGKGTFSHVFKKDDKIYKFWLGDSAYDKFLDYVVKHPLNLCLPKLLSKVKVIKTFFKRHVKTPGEIKYVQLEELKPVTDSYIVQAHPGGKNSLGEFEAETVTIYDICATLATAGRKEKKNAVKVNELALKFLGMEVNYDKVRNPDLLNLVKTVSELITMDGIESDLHSGNFMLRGDQLVIIDPCVDTEELELMRWLKNIRNQEGWSTADVVTGHKLTKEHQDA